MNTLMNDEEMRSGFLTGGLLAAVWAIAAALQPTSTYHLAPILIAGAVPVLGSRSSAPRSRLVLAAAGGALIAAIGAALLAGFDLLQGPTLLPYGGAFAEALTFTVAGAVGGIVIALALPRESESDGSRVSEQ